MNIYNQLTVSIEQHFKHLKQSNRFYKRIFSGEMTVTEFTNFLKNVSFLTANTPAHLRKARECSKAMGLPDLANYYGTKMAEEVDHDKWGDSDVAGITSHFQVPISSLGILPEMQEFVRANESLIQADPFDYFIYVLFAEYFTVIAGPECLLAIERSCKIPQELMSIIGRHAELDRHHVQEWAEESVAVGLDPKRMPHYMVILAEIVRRYDHFCEALCENYAKSIS